VWLPSEFESSPLISFLFLCHWVNVGYPEFVFSRFYLFNIVPFFLFIVKITKRGTMG